MIRTISVVAHVVTSVAVCAAAGFSVHAQEAESPPGIEFEGQVAGFADAVLAGDGDDDAQLGGKAELGVTFNSEGLGLWRGTSLSIGLEQNFGDDVNDAGTGTLLPVNAAMAFPRSGDEDFDLTISLTQALGEKTSITVGKISTLGLAEQTPILGGGGMDTFQNVGLAAPVSGVMPPYILGGILATQAGPAQLSFMVYDPRNAQDEDVIEDPFSDGVTVAASAFLPTAGGTVHGVTLIVNDREGLDLQDIPQLILPDGTIGDLGTRRGSVYAAYSIQHFYEIDPATGKGWGFFGQIGFSDGNPNPVRGNVLAGLGGDATFFNRPQDRWGVGTFRYILSGSVKDGLAGYGIGVQDEYGAEAFYEFGIGKYFRIGADFQAVRPGIKAADDVVVGSLRTRFVF